MDRVTPFEICEALLDWFENAPKELPTSTVSQRDTVLAGDDRPLVDLLREATAGEIGEGDE